MSKEINIDSIEIQLKPGFYLKKINENSFLSNNQSKNSIRAMQKPHTVDFQEYLRTQQDECRDSDSESLEYLQSQQKSSNNQSQDWPKKRQKIEVQIGENYTFADQNSNRKRRDQLYHNLKALSKRQNSDKAQNSALNLLRIKRQLQQKNSSNNDSSFSQKFSNIQSSNDQNSKEISLSDNQQDSGLVIFKEKQIQEEMFLKISQQTKQILSLQQKVYYFQDFCKRLLKSGQESAQTLKNLKKQLKTTKVKVKNKNITLRQLEQKLTARQKQYFDLKSLYLAEKNNVKTQGHARTSSSSKKQVQKDRKALIERQDNLNINAMKLQNQKKILQQSYRMLSLSYSQNQLKLAKLQKEQFQLKEKGLKYTLVQRQLCVVKQENQKLKTKTKNLQNINMILEKQTSELNTKIFRLEQQIQRAICKKYAYNLTRIKNLSTEGNDDLSWKNYPSIKSGLTDLIQRRI